MGGDDVLRGRFRQLAAMVVDGGDDILRRHLAPIREGRGGADPESPALGAVQPFPALRGVAGQLAIRGDLGEGGVRRETDRQHVGVGVGAGVEAVRGAALGHCDARDAALLGRGPGWRAHQAEGSERGAALKHAATAGLDEGWKHVRLSCQRRRAEPRSLVGHVCLPHPRQCSGGRLVKQAWRRAVRVRGGWSRCAPRFGVASMPSATPLTPRAALRRASGAQPGRRP